MAAKPAGPAAKPKAAPKPKATAKPTTAAKPKRGSAEPPTQKVEPEAAQPRTRSDASGASAPRTGKDRFQIIGIDYWAATSGPDHADEVEYVIESFDTEEEARAYAAKAGARPHQGTDAELADGVILRDTQTGEILDARRRPGGRKR